MELHTGNIFWNLLLFAGGFLLLIKGSDLFVETAAKTARRYHVSELTIGLTLVSFGTALPEFAAALCAALQQEGDFVLGNVVGSVTSNILLVLGAGIALGGGMRYTPRLFRSDGAILAASLVLICVLALISGKLHWPSALVLLACGIANFYRFFHQTNLPDESDGGSAAANLFLAFLQLAGSFLMIAAGSKMMVDNAVWGAEQMGISPLVISATIVGFGSALPELAVTITGVLKRHHSLAVGNIIGSCIFNVLMILGCCSLITPLPAAGWDCRINLFFMAASGFLLWTMLGLCRGRLRRSCGILFLLIYLGFWLVNFLG